MSNPELQPGLVQTLSSSRQRSMQVTGKGFLDCAADTVVLSFDIAEKQFEYAAAVDKLNV